MLSIMLRKDFWLYLKEWDVKSVIFCFLNQPRSPLNPHITFLTADQETLKTKQSDCMGSIKSHNGAGLSLFNGQNFHFSSVT